MRLWLHIFLFFALAFSFGRLALRTKTVTLGYDIGKLKDYEANLLKERGLLAMDLAKISSRQELLRRIEAKGE